MTQPTASFSALSLLAGKTGEFTAGQESEADGVFPCLKDKASKQGGASTVPFI
jgi:hypothetical protein